MHCIGVNAPSNRNTSISTCHRKHEAEKKTCLRMTHVRGGNSTFTPLVFSTTGGMAVKWDHSYSSTLSWLRCRIWLLIIAVSHTKHQRYPLFSWPRHKVNTPCRPDQQWGTIWLRLKWHIELILFHFPSPLVPFFYFSQNLLHMYSFAFIPSLMASCVLRYFTDFRTNCTQNSLYAPAHPPLQRFQAAAGLTEGPLGESNL